MSFDDSSLFSQIADREREDIPEFQFDETPAADPIGEVPGETQTGTAANGDPVKQLPPLTEDDIIFAEGGLELFDETRAMILSVYATGDIESAERYRYYKDFENGKHKYIVRAAARLIQKWQLSTSPESLLAGALISSSFFLWKKAEKDRKYVKEERAKEEQEKQAKEQQKQQPGEGKIIEMPISKAL